MKNLTIAISILCLLVLNIKTKANEQITSNYLQKMSQTSISIPQNEIAQKVMTIIVEKLGVRESEVTMEASFVNDFGADPLDMIELFMVFEDEFGIEIPEDDYENLDTVGKVVDYIIEKLGE